MVLTRFVGLQDPGRADLGGVSLSLSVYYLSWLAWRIQGLTNMAQAGAVFQHEQMMQSRTSRAIP